MALQHDQLDTVREAFGERLYRDMTTLMQFRTTLRSGLASSSTLAELESCTHKLAGAAGIFGFRDVSALAAALEESIVNRRTGREHGSVEADLDALIVSIETLSFR